MGKSLGYEEVSLWCVLAGDVVGFVAEFEDGRVDDARGVGGDGLEFYYLWPGLELSVE